jgi:hypothetical protein
MKKYLFFIGVFLLCNLQYSNAQSSFLNSDVFYFKINPTISEVGQIWPVKVDSSLVEDGNTTLYFNEGMLSMYGSRCMDVAGPSVMGPRLTVLNNGNYLFFNRYGDTIKIDMNAPVDSSWVCYQDSNLTVTTQVESIESSSFNGSSEEVHTFRFAVEGNSNYNMTVDERVLKIGRTNGIISTFSWVSFPYLVEFLQLGDRIERNVFLNNQYPTFDEAVNVSKADLYNFQIGDELHITESEWHNTPFIYDRKLIKLKVIGRDENDTLLKISYLSEIQSGLDSTSTAEDSTFLQTYYIYGSIVQDTMVKMYSKENWNEIMPMYHKDYTVNALTVQHGRPSYQIDFYGVDPPYGYDSCAFFDEFYYGGYDNDTYCLGLGGPYYEYHDHEYRSVVTESRVLTYFNLADGSVYGQPIEFISINDNLKLFEFQLYPNPAKAQVKIELPNSEANLKIQIIDMMGRVMHVEESSIQNQTHEIDISKIVRGVYVIQLLKDGNLVGTKHLVKE